MPRKRLNIRDLDSLQAYIDEKMRLDRLDTALLFFTSSLGLWFTIIFAFLGIGMLIRFLPILIPAWAMPIYVGYMRGALTLDCIEERIRGWIYFFVGGGTYVILTINVIIRESLTGPWKEFLSLIFIPIIAFAIGFSAPFFALGIYQIFKQKIILEVFKANGSTTYSAISMAIFVSLLAYISQPGVIQGVGITEIVVFIFLGVLIFGVIYNEIKARRWVRLAIKKQKRGK